MKTIKFVQNGEFITVFIFYKSLFLHAVNLPMRSFHHDRKYSPPEASETRHGRRYLTQTTIHHCHPVVMMVIL